MIGDHVDWALGIRLSVVNRRRDHAAGNRQCKDARLKSAAESWSAQVQAWRIELDRLARSFGAGEASVDPKPGACDYCDQKPFCRIHERETALGVEDETPHES